MNVHTARRKMDGCPIVALGSDGAKQGAGVKASFEAGIDATPAAATP
jgi:TetR/AcrR family transcriptional repressor of nem operon